MTFDTLTTYAQLQGLEPPSPVQIDSLFIRLLGLTAT